MGDFFKALSTGWNEGRERARNESYRSLDKKNFPVKLIEPSIGKTVKLELVEENERAAQMYMNLLTTCAKSLEQYGVQWMIEGKTIQFVFVDENMAENARQTWRK